MVCDGDEVWFKGGRRKYEWDAESCGSFEDIAYGRDLP